MISNTIWKKNTSEFLNALTKARPKDECNLRSLRNTGECVFQIT